MKKANFHTSFTARKSVSNGILKSAQYKTPSFISRPRIQAALNIAKKKIQAAAFISDFTVCLIIRFVITILLYWVEQLTNVLIVLLSIIIHLVVMVSNGEKQKSTQISSLDLNNFVMQYYG